MNTTILNKDLLQCPKKRDEKSLKKVEKQPSAAEMHMNSLMKNEAKVVPTAVETLQMIQNAQVKQDALVEVNRIQITVAQGIYPGQLVLLK